MPSEILSGRPSLVCRAGGSLTATPSSSRSAAASGANAVCTARGVHCTLSHRLGERSDMANASVTTTRAVLDSIVLGKRAMQDAVKEGLVKTEGDPTRLAVLFAALDQPANLMFDILAPGEGR